MRLAEHQNLRGLRFASALSKGVQQAENAGIREGDSESYGPSDGEGDYECNQQTPQVRPTFPSDPSSHDQRTSFHALDAWSRMLTLPALTLTAVNL
jgi:hypothetical protein